MRTSTLLAAALVLAAGAARAAETPPPGGIPDIEAPRTLGLSAAIGAATGNDGLYLNPGAIAARKRYSIEGGAIFDRRGATTTDRFLGGSIVDSESSPIAAGVSYLRAQEGVYRGSVVHFAFAGPIAEGFYVGVGGKYLSLTGQPVSGASPLLPLLPVGATPPNVSAVTADAGVLWQVVELFSVGVAGYNLVPISNKVVAPMGMGAGVAVGSDRSFQVTGDWRADFDRLGKTANRWAVGAEALLANLFPVRAGWMKDDVLDTHWWSAGVGLVSGNGVALDIGYRQSTDDPKARTIGATLKLFVNVPR